MRRKNNLYGIQVSIVTYCKTFLFSVRFLSFQLRKYPNDHTFLPECHCRQYALLSHDWVSPNDPIAFEVALQTIYLDEKFVIGLKSQFQFLE